MTLPDPLRVLHVITSTDVGGAERMLQRTLRALRDRRGPPHVQARLACVKPVGPIGHELRGEGFDVTSLDIPPPGRGPAALAWPAHEVRGILALRREIASFAPHVVQSWLPRAGIVARLAAVGMGVPVLGSVRAIEPDRSWPARLDGLMRGLVARWLAVSEACADHHARVSGIPRDRFTVIPNALDEAELVVPAGAATFRERHGIAPGALLVVSVGRLHPQKGLDVLLRATAAAGSQADVRIALVGDGPHRSGLEALAATLGIGKRVTFTGRLADPREAVAAADAFVLPSRFEGMPGALLEAMALGRACIATAIPGTLEVVRDGVDGLLVAPDDAEALRAALERLGADAALRARLGEAARAHVRSDFLMPKNVERVLALYAEVLA